MSDINKFDLYLTQTILKTSNQRNDNRAVSVGSLAKNINYVQNNPLNININSSGENFNCNMSVNSVSNYDIQYINRIQNTPFFVSYLYNEDFNIKIVDFYDWRQGISIYRLFIFKKLNFEKLSKPVKLNVEFDSELKHVSEKQVNINEVLLQISEKFASNKSDLSFDLSNASPVLCFAIALDFDTKNISSITVDSIVKKFYELKTICESKHISKYFVTKNQKAENELDELWNQQKFILPDLNIDTHILDNDKSFEIEKYWLNDFYMFFSIESKLKFNIKKINEHSSELLDYIPSKSKILKYYKDFDINIDDLNNEIQNWWDVYSLPIFSKTFATKCISESEEVFVVYFLAIKLHLPWASLLFKQIISHLKEESISHLHDFLIFITYFYKRLSKSVINNSEVEYSPGYLWDNNYKSINNEFEITKFSNSVNTKLNVNNDNSFKINKLCRIVFDEKNKKINLFPVINNTKFKILNNLSIVFDGYIVGLPLVWQNGYFEFNKLKVKWILKRNRFQLTIHSTEKKTVQVNNEAFEISPEKKIIHHVEVPKSVAQLYLNIFNKYGGKLFSKITSQHLPVYVSGFAATEYGTISNKILYSTGKRTHQLFDTKDDSMNTNQIQINKDVKELKFLAKHANCVSEIPYFKNNYLDKLLNINIFESGNLILTIDEIFSKDIKKILSFFKFNFDFQPEFILHNEKSEFQLKSNLNIEFLYQHNVPLQESMISNDRKKLVLKGDSVKILLNNLKDLIRNNLKNN